MEGDFRSVAVGRRARFAALFVFALLFAFVVAPTASHATTLPGGVQGTITDNLSNPISNIDAWLYDVTVSSNPAAHSLSDSSGKISFSALPANHDYDLVLIRKSGKSRYSASVKLPTKGSWMVVAYSPGTYAHLWPGTSAAKYVTVK